MSWRGAAVAPDGNSTRESPIDGVLDRGEWFEGARIVLDRSFETEGFDGTPFSIEAGEEHVLSMESANASLRIAFETRSLGEELRVIDGFVPHFFLDTEVPGVARPLRYTLVCKGGTGRLRAARDGARAFGDLAITVACRTYVEGTERDESELELSGVFRAEIKRPRSSRAPP